MQKNPKLRSLRRSGRLSALILVLLAISSRRLAAEENVARAHTAGQISRILQELCSQLSLEKDIQVAITPHNPRFVSVERVTRPRETYFLSFDAQFLNTLTDEELRAAIAHELGHVWIYSHHPYLQTEALANEIALRAVSRESLQKVYTKLWERQGTAGNVSELLGTAN